MSTRRTALTLLVAAISVGVPLSAVSAAAGSTPRAMTGWGIETITATSTSRTPASVTVHASGVYTGTGTFRLPVTGKATTLRFVFGNGTLIADASTAYSVTGHYNCPQNVTSDRTFTVSPKQSTGVFAMATGTSDYTGFSTQYSPRLANGACDLASRVAPLGGTVYVLVTIDGTLTLRGGS